MGDRRRTLHVHGLGLAILLAVTATACTDSADVVDIPSATTTPSAVAAPDLDDTSTTSTTDAPAVTQLATTDPVVTDAPTTEPLPTEPPPTEPPAPTEPPPPTPPPTVEDPFLRIGDEGDRVTLMQLKLRTLDYLQPGYTEGVFDRTTADALIDFQAQYGLVVDGIFGPETDRSLSAAAASVNPEA